MVTETWRHPGFLIYFTSSTVHRILLISSSTGSSWSQSAKYRGGIFVAFAKNGVENLTLFIDRGMHSYHSSECSLSQYFIYFFL